jgi:hypothetical protein
MIARARSLADGDAANIRWSVGMIEEAPLSPPYGLIVCGDSIHWFDWQVTVPLFAEGLAPRGHLAVVQRHWLDDVSERTALRRIFAKYGANPDFAPLDPVVELERRGLFERHGSLTTAPEPWRPTPDELIGCHHSQIGFVLEKMSDPEAFDNELRSLFARSLPVDGDGRYRLTVQAAIAWGRPACGSRS